MRKRKVRKSLKGRIKYDMQNIFWSSLMYKVKIGVRIKGIGTINNQTRMLVVFKDNLIRGILRHGF